MGMFVHILSSSIFALEGKDFKKHSGLLSSFRMEYIKTEIFDNRMSDIIRDLFRIRNKSDYDDFYTVGKSDISEQIANAEHFLTQIKLYLDSHES